VKPKTGRGLSVLAILFSLLALGGSGFTWFQTQVAGVQEESRLALGVSEIGGQVGRLGDSIAQLQREQAAVVSTAELNNKALELRAELSSQVQKLASEQQVLTAAVTKISQDLERGVNDYLIEEVTQLLRLANNSVLFDKNVVSAMNALMLADEQLKSLRDPRFSTIRSQINLELEALKNVQVVDIEALSASLHTLARSVPALPLANEPVERAPVVQELSAEPELTFRGELVKIWRDLIGSVSIQRVDQPPKPLLVPEQRYFLNENIQLALSKAELALLQGETNVYQRSIGDAKRWLSEYFDISDSRVQAALISLDKLAAVSIETQIPPITGSYQALQTVVGGQ
jgi:uroporphyrin-3 C-methyltransferase